MRLFIAVPLDETTRGYIAQLQNKLRSQVSSARFTRAENLHITLHFFGEGYENRLESIIQVMDTLCTPRFTMQLRDLGGFSRGGEGWILWMGASDEMRIRSLHSELCSNLVKQGVCSKTACAASRFTPHITLAREVKTGFCLDELRGGTRILPVNVNSVCLMKSERIGGVLTYTTVHEGLLR